MGFKRVHKPIINALNENNEDEGIKKVFLKWFM